MSTLFHFTSLKPDFFRLLCIFPGRFSSPIICEISEYSVFNPPKYSALSYAWGSTETCRQGMVLNGQDFKISAELNAALRWLRQSDTARYMWIDAICIDQTNVAELNAQVGMMCHIYRRAECVIAWLGKETKDSKRAMAFLREIAHEAKRQRQSTFSHPIRYTTEDEDGNVKVMSTDEIRAAQLSYRKSALEKVVPANHLESCCRELERMDHEKYGHIVTGTPYLYYDFTFIYSSFFTEQRQKDWEALDELLARPWWARTWIVQEVWNSSNCVIQCGRSTLGWSTFQDAMDYQEGWDDMGYMVKKTSRWKYWDLLKKRYGLAIHLSQKKLLGGTLSDILWNVWSREATDPRDKVFAVLSLVETESRDSLPCADYTKTMQQVYQEVAAYIIHHEQKLDILLAANGLERRSGLPSWVPDWRREANDDRPQLFINGSRMRLLQYFSMSTDLVEVRGHGFYASGDSTVWAKTSGDSDILQVRGWILGIVEQMTTVYEAKMSTESIVEEARSILPLEKRDQGVSISDYDLGILIQAAWERQAQRESTLPQGQRSAEPDQTGSISEKELRNILRASFPEARDMPGRSEDELIRNIMHNRRFFVTTAGHLCVGPAATQPGDQIYIIAGCNFPMVLRSEGEFYGLVGEAYGENLH